MKRTPGKQASLAGMLMLCLAQLFALDAYAQLPLPAAGQNALRIEGSNTIGDALAPALVEALMQREGLKNIKIQTMPEANLKRITGQAANGQAVHVEVVAQGSSAGFTALAEQRAEVAASSRPIRDQEVERLAAAGDMRSASAEQVIGIDGVAVIVHPRNALNQLTSAQLAGVFSGSIKTWEELGGSGGEIRVMTMDDNSGTFDTFNTAVLAAQGMTLRTDTVRYAVSSVLADDVAQTPQSIGFVGLAYVGKAKPLAIADGQAEAMAPTLGLVASEDYPLSRRLFLYLKPDEQNPWARALVAFAQSPEGQQVVAANGFVAQTVSAIKVDVSTDMPERYRHLVEHAQRLSVTFRFNEGNATLDNKAIQDVQRIVSFLKAENKLSARVSLIGFGDAKEDPARALLLSKLRAMAVRRELSKAGVTVQDVEGLGQILPVASNEIESGRIKNRRVEVWVY